VVVVVVEIAGGAEATTVLLTDGAVRKALPIAAKGLAFAADSAVALAADGSFLN
jgi:hypothetical protein